MVEALERFIQHLLGIVFFFHYEDFELLNRAEHSGEDFGHIGIRLVVVAVYEAEVVKVGHVGAGEEGFDAGLEEEVFYCESVDSGEGESLMQDPPGFVIPERLEVEGERGYDVEILGGSVPECGVLGYRNFLSA